ncbi:energy-coupling factor transporter transmembrane component T [Micromonospora craniellae]|uniref:Energy-coupling factor transporter transmembrane protein EcfT n=1 Tax=Micromonospora craniellae TaxID=2294034 RepID=A0A372FXR3_9ACTN|nr:energy-coupling factor transporter transmembrane component T [Micromonospora craniellae]RFS45601.1 energy-coupling factor transporter transmembrane protein EcfT [Micromonospora craniellae]
MHSAHHSRRGSRDGRRLGLRRVARRPGGIVVSRATAVSPGATAFASTVRVDPRIRLLIATAVTVASFVLSEPLTANCLVLLAATLMIIVGRGPAALVLTAVAAAAAIAATTVTQVENNTLMLTLAMLIYLVQKLTVMTMMGLFLTAGISVALAVSTLETLRAPATVTVPLAVALRFLPTIRQDWSALADSLAVRGIAPTPRSLLTHPVRTAEHLVVPILMRALRTSDDLACAGLVRGLDTRGPRTVLHELYLRPADIVLAAVTITATSALVLVQYL